MLHRPDVVDGWLPAVLQSLEQDALPTPVAWLGFAACAPSVPQLLDADVLCFTAGAWLCSGDARLFAEPRFSAHKGLLRRGEPQPRLAPEELLLRPEGELRSPGDRETWLLEELLRLLDAEPSRPEELPFASDRPSSQLSAESLPSAVQLRSLLARERSPSRLRRRLRGDASRPSLSRDVRLRSRESRLLS